MASIVMSKRISPLSDRRGQQGLLPFALLSLIMLTPSFAAGDASLDSPASISTPVAVTAEIPPSPVAEPALLSLDDAETTSAPVASLPSDAASVDKDKAADQPANHQPTTLEADETMSNPVATLPTDATDQQAAKPATIEFVAEPAAAPLSAEAAVDSASEGTVESSVESPAESTVESSSESTVESSSAEQPVAATIENPAEHQPALLAVAEPTEVAMAEHAPTPVSLMPADAAPEAIAEAKGEAEPVAMVGDSAEPSTASAENAMSEEAPMPVTAPVAEQAEQSAESQQGDKPVAEPVVESAEDSAAAPLAEPEKVSAIEPIEQAIEHAPKDATAGNLFEVIFSFSLVIGLMLLFLWGVKRWQPKFVPGRSGLEIRAMLSLGGRDRLVVVQAGERQILLGVSPGRITLLGDYDELLAQPEDGKASAGETFKQLLKR